MARRQTTKTALPEDSSTAETGMEAISLAPASKANSGEANLRVGTTSKISREDKHGSHRESETAAVVGRASEQRVSSTGEVEKRQGPGPWPAKTSCNVEGNPTGKGKEMCEFVYSSAAAELKASSMKFIA